MLRIYDNVGVERDSGAVRKHAVPRRDRNTCCSKLLLILVAVIVISAGLALYEKICADDDIYPVAIPTFCLLHRCRSRPFPFNVFDAVINGKPANLPGRRYMLIDRGLFNTFVPEPNLEQCNRAWSRHRRTITKENNTFTLQQRTRVVNTATRLIARELDGRRDRHERAFMNDEGNRRYLTREFLRRIDFCVKELGTRVTELTVYTDEYEKLCPGCRARARQVRKARRQQQQLVEAQLAARKQEREARRSADRAAGRNQPQPKDPRRSEMWELVSQYARAPLPGTMYSCAVGAILVLILRRPILRLLQCLVVLARCLLAFLFVCATAGYLMGGKWHVFLLLARRLIINSVLPLNLALVCISRVISIICTVVLVCRHQNTRIAPCCGEACEQR